MDLARGHVRTDPMNACQISLKLKPLVAGVTRNREHLGQGEFLIAVKDLELFDFGERLIAGPVRRETLDFNRNRRFAAIGEP